ncbi:unnamed protein product [Periconia digitata]|uniref:Uncharacterized protein n=1 Tax=Periconia digitata TaxID=1303443 RepID=A0A9W4XYA8_9PLEO|nr:unnamed protein product [Periconia digitata]
MRKSTLHTLAVPPGIGCTISSRWIISRLCRHTGILGFRSTSRTASTVISQHCIRSLVPMNASSSSHLDHPSTVMPSPSPILSKQFWYTAPDANVASNIIISKTVALLLSLLQKRIRGRQTSFAVIKMARVLSPS